MFLPYASRELVSAGIRAASAECGTISSLLAALLPTRNLVVTRCNTLKLLSGLETK